MSSTENRVNLEFVMAELGNVSENLVEFFRKSSLLMFCTILREALEKRHKHTADSDLKKKVVKSGYIIGGVDPTDQCVSRSRKYIQVKGTYVRRVWRVSGTSSFGSDEKLKPHFVFLRGNEIFREWVWVRKVLL